MRRIFSAIVIIFVCAAACFANNADVDSRRLVLSVEVTNGTENGHAVSGDNATLTIYEHNKLIDRFESKVGTDGTVLFENIQAGEHSVAVAHVFHEGMSFGSNAIVLKAGQEQANAQVQVFDVSYDTSGLSAKTHHIILKRQDDSVLLTEYIQLVNTSDMAIGSKQKDSAGRPMVLKVPLPKGFQNFTSSSYLEPQALGFTEQSFYDTMGVPPGSHEIIFSYTLEIKSDTIDITKKISLPTSHFVLYSQLGEKKIQGLGDVAGELALGDGTSSEYFVLGNLTFGKEVKFKIAGLSMSVGNKSSWIILAVVFGVIIVVAVLRLRRSENQTISV
ncbi:MAG: hypothetical protein WBC22_14525 [Sedimentisphaerales bacterium]